MDEHFGGLLRRVTMGLISALVLAGCDSGAVPSGEMDPDQVMATEPGGICRTATENRNLTLTCPSGTIQKVDFASYGTPSGNCGSFATSSCNASSSRSVVENQCLGKSTCTVPATNAIFGDPCPNVVKRLTAQVHCGGICGSANEGSNVTLTCPSGTVIQGVNFASYGTMPTGACGSLVASSCYAANSKSVVEELCLGKSTCTVPATNAIFGDACPNTAKSLNVEVACVGGQVSIAATAHAVEPSTNGTFMVSMSLASSTPTVVGYTTSGTATAGSDYKALSGTVTIPAGATVAPIEVSVNDDAVKEGVETVIVKLSAVTSGTVPIGSQNSATVNITSNDEGEVTDVQVAPGNTLVALSWTEPTDANYAGVRLSYSPSGATPIDIPRGTALREVKGLVNGTEYVFLLQGYDTGGKVSAGVTVRATPSDVAPAKVVTKRILHMRARFTDDPPGYVPDEDSVLQKEVQRTVDDFYRASNGLARINLTVTPTLNVGHPHSYYSSACPNVDWPKMNQLIEDAKAAAGSTGYSVNQDVFSLRYDGQPGCCCAWGGGDRTWLRFFGSEHHEWCHNFNVGDEICKRSNNTSQPLDPNRSDAGRNIWTPVGAETSPNLFFNVMDLSTRMGMYTADNFYAPRTNGRYRIYNRSIEPLNYHPKTKYGIRIRDAHHTYMIEYRTLSPFPSDTTTPNGVLLFDEDGNCIDMTPMTPSTQDAVLQIGKSVPSGDGTFTIRPVARGGAGAAAYMDVEVTFP